MQLSVIIINYNVRYFLEQCLLSVQKALEGIDSEIIVVDNNSSDDSCAMMKQLFPNIKRIENKENLGFPKGNNIAVAEAKGEYICILNPDTIVAEDTFTKIFARHEAIASNLGIIGCKLIDGTGNFLPESKRGVPTPWVAFTKIFGLYKIVPKNKWFNQYYAMHLAENQSGEVAILVGAFMFMKKELYDKLGGFDENCFMYSDDIDLSYMALKNNFQNFYFANTTVIHYKGESTVRDEHYMKRFSEAMQFFYQKHFKRSLVFDVFMKIGTFIFVKFKKQQQKTTKKAIDNYVVFSKNSFSLPINKPVKYLNNFTNFVPDKNKTTEIIFDTSCFSFKEIIQFMELHKSKNLSFKNYISQSHYCIGSNNANDRGEVMKL